MKTCQGLRASATSRSNSSRGQRDRLPVPLDRVPGDIDDEVTDGELLGCRLLRPAQPGPYPGHELLGLERLDHIIVGAGLQAHHHVDGVALRGEHDDGHPGLGTDLTAYVDAVPPGEHEVEENQIRLGLTESSEGLVTVGHERRLKTFAAQHDAKHLCQCGVVVDDQDASLHSDHHPIFASIALTMVFVVTPP